MGGSIYGEIPGLRAFGATRRDGEAGSYELVEVLERWIALRLTWNLPVSAMVGVDVEVPPGG